MSSLHLQKLREGVEEEEEERENVREMQDRPGGNRLC